MEMQTSETPRRFTASRPVKTSCLPAVSLHDVTVSRTWPERRSGSDRRVIDTRIDLDPTSAWLGEMDRRHAERRQYSGAAVSGFGSLELESEVRS